MALSTNLVRKLQIALADADAAAELKAAIDANSSGAMTFTVYGAYSVTPVARPSAFTQTYATATKTHSNPTAVAVVTTASTSTTPFGYSQVQADAIVTAINALVIDMVNVKSVLNSVIDDLQSEGWLA